MQWLTVPMFAGTIVCVIKSIQAMPDGHSKMEAGLAGMLISAILAVLGLISLVFAVIWNCGTSVRSPRTTI